ncbi:hypothetical protein [Mesoflavibacter zeaxanthinifaciens]|uniref:hypothetical protein n=1 Tax=Mesoflavibacter zeaxanthinifaciens TaxID=393060 RepID=UPI003A9375A1
MKNKFFIIPIVVIFSSCYDSYVKRINEEAYKIEIIGVISNVRYSAHGELYVTVKEKEHFLVAFDIYEKGTNIYVGDSIYKKKDSKYLEHHRKRQQENTYYLDETYEIYDVYSKKLNEKK